VNTVASQSSKFKDKYHFFVIQVVKNANPKNHTQKQYVVTSAENDGDKQMSWEEIIKIEPHLQDKEEIFQAKPLTKEESEFYKKYKSGISDEKFAKLPYDQKDMFMNIYVNLEKGLTDKQYSSLPEDLRNKYIGFGVGLTDIQYNITSDKLRKRYNDVTIKKIETLIEQKRDVKLRNSEIEIFKNNIHKFDLNKLSDEIIHMLIVNDDKMSKLIIQNKKLSDNNIYALLSYADKQETAKLIMQYNKELSGDAITSLLHHATDKQEMVKLLGSENINKLSGDSVYGLLNRTADKQEIAKLLGSENINKLSDNDVHDLLNFTKYKQEMVKLLGSENINKLSDRSISTLLSYATDKQEMAKLLGSENIDKIPKNYIYITLLSSEMDDRRETIKALGKNINKLSDQDIKNLLRYADPDEANPVKNRQEIKQMLIDAGVKIPE